MSDDTVPFASHVTERRGVFQYVRRVPKDVADRVPIRRVQVSLRTRDRATAYQLAAVEHARWERAFQQARLEGGRAAPFVSVADWTAEDWRQAVEWYRLTCLHEDWRRRCESATGEQIAAGTWQVPWTEERQRVSAEWHRAGRAVQRASVQDYVEYHLTRPRSLLARIGVTLVKGDVHFVDVARWLQAADIAVWETQWQRERGQTGEDAHPDTILGPWRSDRHDFRHRAPNDVPADRTAVTSEPEPAATGKTLEDCFAAWREERARTGKVVSPSARAEKDRSIRDFGSTLDDDDIAFVSRERLMAWRDELFGKNLAAGTVNKRLSDINALMKTAKHRGWITVWDNTDTHTAPSAGEDTREPYDSADLELIFSQPSFRDGALARQKRAGAELQVWIPLLSCLHGLISSEILQLGPDDVVTDERSGIRCFRVTNANGRRNKTDARRRLVPIRSEVEDLGLDDLVGRARRGGWSTLWPGMEEATNLDIRDRATPISNAFSAWWSQYARKTLRISDDRKVLYSFRHAFEDALRKGGTPKEHRDLLMGHAEQGTGARYGTKREPTPVNVEALSNGIQKAEWAFLSGLKKLPVPKIETRK